MKIFLPAKWVKLTLFLALIWPMGGRAQDTSESKEVALEGVSAAEIESIRRQEALISAQSMLKEAEALLQQGDYPKAASLYQDAAKRLAMAPASQAELDRIHQGASICFFKLAEESYEKKDYAAAREKAQKAYDYNPENRDALALVERASGQITGDEDRRQKTEAALAARPKEISNSDFVSKQKKVLEFYRASENYFKSEQFDLAELALKDVLRIDPYSATAYHRLREVQLAKYKKLNSAKQQTETQSMLDVQEAWKLPIKRDQRRGLDGPIDDELGTQGGKVSILKKLNSIIIKKIDFENVPVLSAINYLINESREADPGKEGVNIIAAFEKDRQAGVPVSAPAPVLPGAGEFAPEGGAAPVAGFGAAEAAPTVSPSSMTVTLNLRNVPLLQAIKFLTQVTGLKYRIEPDAVVIVSPDALDRQTQTRYFNVSPGIFRSVIEKTEAAGAGGGGNRGGGGAGGGFVGINAGGVTTRAADVKKAFEDFGIEFPRGTSISYNEALGVLVARHTNEVLDQIEQIILRLNKTPPQVQIEAKFIDVKQDDLNELGFRWAFAPSKQTDFTIESGQGTSLPGIPIGGPYRGLGNPLTGGNRNAASLSASALDALLAGTGGGGLIAAGANTILSVTGVLTNPQVQVMIDALAQKGMTNLLSAPRVTTTSGESAKILITREFIYPSSFTDPQVQAGTSSSTGGTGSVGIVAPSPSAFTTREIGVILDVKPTVSSDSYTINITLAPEVIDFEGFVNYNTFAVANSTQFTFTIPQPIFNKRTLQTSVVIWDGQTVVLGGLIREDTRKVSDKVPFLGDLPLLGRLFQSKVESSVKRNLMIFLTARIVDPAGNPVNRMQEARYIPEENGTPLNSN